MGIKSNQDNRPLRNKPGIKMNVGEECKAETMGVSEADGELRWDRGILQRLNSRMSEVGF